MIIIKCQKKKINEVIGEVGTHARKSKVFHSFLSPCDRAISPPVEDWVRQVILVSRLLFSQAARAVSWVCPNCFSITGVCFQTCTHTENNYTSAAAAPPRDGREQGVWWESEPIPDPPKGYKRRNKTKTLPWALDEFRCGGVFRAIMESSIFIFFTCILEKKLSIFQE